MVKPTEPTTKKPTKNGQTNVFTLSEDDAATVRAAEMAIMEQHRLLGVAREQYFATEARLAQSIGEARKSYQSVLHAMAQKLGIDLTSKEAWSFDAKTMTFSKKTPPVQ